MSKRFAIGGAVESGKLDLVDGNWNQIMGERWSGPSLRQPVLHSTSRLVEMDSKRPRLSLLPSLHFTENVVDPSRPESLTIVEMVWRRGVQYLDG